jgi:uncharacterized protein
MVLPYEPRSEGTPTPMESMGTRNQCQQDRADLVDCHRWVYLRPMEERRSNEEAMSTLKARLHQDVITHMKGGNKVALNTVRNVLGEISTREKSGKTPVELDDAQVTALLQKEAAKRRDTAGIYTEAGESDRAAAEIAEAEVIEAYLPKPLSRPEVEAIVDEEIAALRAEGQELGMRQMGAVMKAVTAKVAGRFDGKAVSDLVRSRLV